MISPLSAGRSATSVLRCCSAIRSTARSTSSSGTSTTSRSMSRSAKLGSGISGNTSRDILYSRSVPSLNETMSTFGGNAGRRLCSRIASAEVSCKVLSSTSPRTELPKRWRRICIGTLPGRKPRSWIVRPISPSRLVTFSSSSPAGTTTRNSRLRPSALVSVTCMKAGLCFPNYSKDGGAGGGI